MVSGIHFLRDDISISRSEKRVLRGIHVAEKIRSKSIEKISSGKKFPNGYEDIFQSLYADKMHTIKNFNERFYKILYEYYSSISHLYGYSSYCEFYDGK